MALPAKASDALAAVRSPHDVRPAAHTVAARHGARSDDVVGDRVDQAAAEQRRSVAHRGDVDAGRDTRLPIAGDAELCDGVRRGDRAAAAHDEQAGLRELPDAHHRRQPVSSGAPDPRLEVAPHARPVVEQRTQALVRRKARAEELCAAGALAWRVALERDDVEHGCREEHDRATAGDPRRCLQREAPNAGSSTTEPAGFAAAAAAAAQRCPDPVAARRHRDPVQPAGAHDAPPARAIRATATTRPSWRTRTIVPEPRLAT